MIRHFIYCRKSTEEEERQILSIEAQLTELRQYATQNGLLVVKEFAESKTAKEPGRPIFNQMVDEIEAGGAAGILAWNPDRLARNSVDGGRVIYLVDTGKIQSLKFPTFWFEPTPQGKFMLSVAFGQSKYYVDNLRENVHRGIRQKLRRGELPGKAPLGYFNEPRLRTIEPDPETFKKVTKVLELFATGAYKKAQIQQQMFALGLKGKDGKPIHLTSIGHMLVNPFYYGHFLFKGELHQGSHKPMITKAHFDRIQKALRDNGKPRKNGQRKEFLFLGFARCGECGYTVTAERQTKKSGRSYVYYRCTKKSKSQKCKQSRFLREERLAAQVAQICQNAALPAEWRDRFLSRIDDWQAEESRDATVGAQNLKIELQHINARIDRLLDVYLDGALEEAEFKRKKNTLMESKAQIQQRIDDFERQGDNRLELLRNWVIKASSLEDTVRQGNLAAMRDFLKINGSNRRLTDGTLEIKLNNPWSYMPRANIRARAEGPGESLNRLWWAGRDLNSHELTLNGF